MSKKKDTCVSSTSSAGLADSASDLREPDLFKRLPSASKNPSVRPSSESTGITSQSSTTCEPSRQMDLEELTSLSAAGRANLGVRPGSNEARKMTVTSGRKWLALLESYGRAGLLGKMCAALLTNQWGSSAAFLTWKASAMKPSHLLFQLAPSMPRTAATAFGSSPRKMTPTPTASDHIERTSTSTEKMNPLTGKSVSLDRFVRFWPDPETQQSGVPRLLHTPTAKANQMAPSMKERNPGSWWPTPTASEGTGAQQNAGRAGGSSLRETVKLWATPTAAIAVGSTCQDSKGKRDLRLEVDGQLNPTWVEWLMGFPEGWTDLKPSEMPSSRKSLSKSGGRSSQRRTKRDE